MLAPFEICVRMKIDVDGAPNAYGPPGKLTLDYELNAHEYAKPNGEIVGYITQPDPQNPSRRIPVVQGPNDPYPGYYISRTGFCDVHNSNELDPRRYVDASKINYIVLGDRAFNNQVRLGDFVAVYSVTQKVRVFGIVGDAGNTTGEEGSLALLQALGYPFKDGKAGEVENPEIVVRHFPESNPQRMFFQTQKQIDDEALKLQLSKAFAG